MLGAQTWFVVFAVPTVAIGSFIATRKKLAYQWRDELMDPGGNIYPTVTDTDMAYFRRVSAAEDVEHYSNVKGRYGSSSDANTLPCGQGLSAVENLGWFVSYVENFGKIYADACLSDIKRHAEQIGISCDERKMNSLAKRVQLETDAGELQSWQFNLEDYNGNRIISDHAEDTQLMKAPWLSGDSLQWEKMPAVMRYLSHQVQKVYPDIGRLRHVYVEYSPSGLFFKDPKSPKSFDGHDYVIIPLRRDRQDTVLTFVPALRSKFPRLSDILRYSWTSRDIDARLPNGAMLRVYGTARYDWGWAVRPGPSWWGSHLQPLQPSLLSSTSMDHSDTWGSRFLKKWWHLNTPQPQRTSSIGEDAALVVLHYEGPRAKGKKRSMLFHPEALIFGYPPRVENFEVWQEDRPTEDHIQKMGLIKFLVSNYLTMFRVS